MNVGARTRQGFPARGPGVRDLAARLRYREHSAVWLLLAALILAVPQARAQEDSRSEYEVKAAFLFNFGKFVDWPPSSFAGPESAFWVCVVGEDPFGHLLEDQFMGKKIGERPVQIGRYRTLKAAIQSRSCHILFLSASLKRQLRQVVDSLRGANALLVGDTPDFAASGGAIELTLEENRVRLTINPDAAERAGLRLSSKLLSLARIVHDAAGDGRS